MAKTRIVLDVTHEDDMDPALLAADMITMAMGGQGITVVKQYALAKMVPWDRKKFVEAIMVHGAGIQPRLADIAIIAYAAGPDPDDAEWLDAMSEYIWDHIMGEPEDPSLHDFRTYVQKLWEEGCPEVIG